MKKLNLFLALLFLGLNYFYAQVGIDTDTPDPSAIMDVVSSEKGFLPPRMTSEQRDAITAPAKALTIFNLDEKCLEVNVGDEVNPDWQCLGTAVSTIPEIPNTIVLDQDLRSFIGSTFDDDYTPYDAATQPAGEGAIDAVAADGTTDPLLDFPGILDATGVLIRIPATATGPGTLPAFSTTKTVDAVNTENNTATEVTLSWESQTYDAGTEFIIATITANSGDLNVKKLDLNRGIGSDKAGILLTEFEYPYDSNGGITTLEYRAVPGIPDRNIADQMHAFIYLPVESATGETWINNNLGANYNNLNHPDFDPAAQATAFNDANAYGSLFNWGRRSDGHEFRDNNVSSLPFTTPVPNSNGIVSGRFYLAPTEAEFTALWDGEAAPNNPCPVGFRVPTEAEMNAEKDTWSPSNRLGAAASSLAITAAGVRISAAAPLNSGNFGYYLSSTTVTNAATGYFINASGAFVNNRTYGQLASVRCIKD